METEPPLAIAVDDSTPKPTAAAMTQVAIYFGVLVLAFGLSAPWNGGISSIPIQFFLKNVKHMSASQNAVYGAITAIPLYLGFLFGFLRDRFRHSRWGDQAYLLGASVLATAIFVWLSSGQVTYARLVMGALSATLLFQVINAAIQAMTAIVAQRKLLTGWLSAITTLGLTLPTAISSLAGGWLAANVPPQKTFLLVAAVTAVIIIQAVVRPREIFAAEHAGGTHAESHWSAMGRLLRHKTIWIPLIIQFLWNFAPAYGTPALYYLTNQVHLTSGQFGVYNALNTGFFLPMVLLYGFVCRWLNLRTLLWVGTVLGIMQGPPLLFAHDYHTAMAAGVAFGLLGGFGSAAYWDLLLRCCPKGLEGTATMLGWSLYWAANKSSDVLGSALFDHYKRGMHAHGEGVGFVVTIVVTTIAYVLIIPMLFLVPKAIGTAREGDAAAVTP